MMSASPSSEMQRSRSGMGARSPLNTSASRMRHVPSAASVGIPTQALGTAPPPSPLAPGVPPPPLASPPPPAPPPPPPAPPAPPRDNTRVAMMRELAALLPSAPTDSRSPRTNGCGTAAGQSKVSNVYSDMGTACAAAALVASLCVASTPAAASWSASGAAAAAAFTSAVCDGGRRMESTLRHRPRTL